jgi:hypothetical protein
MPTFDQVESLNTQCYIYKKTGWQIESLQYCRITNDKYVFQIFFIKEDYGNTVVDAALILSNGDIIWSASIEIENALYKVAANEWTESRFNQWVDSQPPEKVTVYKPAKTKD